MSETRTPWLTDQVVLVSGGTQGVGAAVARRAAAEGAAAVVVTGRRPELGEAVADELTSTGTQGLFVPTDLRDVAQARASVVATIERFGRLDRVVNAAGYTARGSMLDTTPELFDTHMAINVRAPFFIMSQTIAHLRERGVPGSIVNIGSISAHAGQPYLAPYVAAKAALAGLTRNAAHAHRWDRIRVNCVNMGWTATEGETSIQKRAHGADDDWLARADASVPMGRIGRPGQIAEFVTFLLSDHSGVVTGSVLDWDQIVIGGQD